MLASRFDYHLPAELIAQRPPECRHDSRLLVLGSDGVRHLTFSRFPRLLKPGDALVINDTRVIPARLHGRKPTGGALEILLVEGSARRWRCMARGSGLKPGMQAELSGGVRATFGERLDGFWNVTFNVDLDAGGLLERIGEAPTPPYIKERLKDGERYQTVYAREAGAIASPTAGLHFTREMLDEITGMGVSVEMLTLHIGPGTFLPLRTDNVEEHDMHPEHVHITSKTADELNRVREEGGRWCMVGTSVMRAMESACTSGGRVRAVDAPTNLFIRPGHEFLSRPELLLTNFHLPRSTNLLLACSYGGTERVLEAYRQAVDFRYRFYSFGDAMLIQGDRH